MDSAIFLCSRPGQLHAAALARILFEGKELNMQGLSNREFIGCGSLIHCLAYQLGAIVRWNLARNDRERFLSEHWEPERWPSKSNKWDNFNPIQNLLGLAHEVIDGDSRLNSPAWAYASSTEYTPLLLVFNGFFRYLAYSTLPGMELLEDVQIAMQLWLRLLQVSGVDLIEYGRKEKEVHRTQNVGSRWAYWRTCRRIGYTDRCCYKLITFDHGAEPSDWNFWFREDQFWIDIYFRQFWDMIDHPERMIPGAWNEAHSWDDSDDTDDSDDYDEFDD
jgi:hypothetical protein